MKKVLLITIFTTTAFLTSGCFPKEKNTINFDQSINILNYQIKDTIKYYNNYISNSGISNHEINLKVSSDNNNLYLNSEIKLNIGIDGLISNYSSDSIYKIDIIDKIENKKILSSGGFDYYNIDYIPYLRLNNFNINMGTGNIEAEFIKSLLGGIQQKRIMIDLENKINPTQDYVNIIKLFYIIQQITDCDAFYKIRSTIYRGNRSYKIGIKTGNLSQCIKQSPYNYEGLIFEGFVSPKNKKEVELEITKLKSSYNSDLNISGLIGAKDIKLEIYNKNTKEKKLVNIKHGTQKDLIDIIDNYYETSINIEKNNNYLEYHGTILVKRSDRNLQDLTFDIQGNLNLQNTGYLNINPPQNYIIMSQILGDNFSLKDILSNQR